MILKRRIIFILALVALSSFLTSCTKTSSKNVEASKKIKIGFVLATMNEERYAKDHRYFLDYAQKKGAEVEFASCDDQVNLQISKVETLLSKGIDALVIQPVNGEAAAALVNLAKRDKVPVIAYDRLIKNADIDLYVTQNSFEVGVIQAKAAVEATHQKGNYVILMGEAGHSVAEQITQGNLSVLNQFPDIHVVVQQNHEGWSTSLALSTVENALTRNGNKIDAILANNDGMAMGAIQALEEQKLVGKVFVAGADADLSAVRDVVSGRQSLTVLKGIQPLAEAAVDAAIALATNQIPTSQAKINNGLKEIPVVHTPVFEVVKNNVQQQIVDYGFHSAESVFNTSSHTR